MIATRYLQVLLTITFVNAALSLSCEPGEELKSYTFTWDVGQKIGSYTWRKDIETISLCYTTITGWNQTMRKKVSCDNYANYTASFNDQKTSLTVKNVTRQDQGTFIVIWESSTNSCDFKVYARPESVSCQVLEPQPNMVNFKVVCTVSRTYPSPRCQFSWERNGTTMILANQQPITYENMTAQGQVEYFYQTCTLTHPVQDLGLGSHAFRVMAYPSVYGNSNDTKYGVDSDLTSSVTISYPTVELESCTQEYVQEGSTVSCSCKETANTFLSATTSFSQGSTVKSSGPGLTTYNFTASRNITQDLICQATLLNWTSSNVTYKLPQVAYGPKNVTVKVNNLAAPGDISLCDKSHPVTVNVTCTVSVDGVSPGADYEFIINGSSRPTSPMGSSSLTYSVTTGGLLSVQCNATNSGIKDLTAASPEKLVQVIEPPAAPPIIDTYQDSGSPVALTDGHLTVQEGVNTSIRCRAEGGYPSVSSVTVSCGTLTTTSVGNVAFLDVNVNRSRDASECSCTATHSSLCYRSNKTVLSLEVLFGPTLVSFTVNETAETEIVVEKDSELRLACEAEGNPSPSLALTKDGLQLEVYNGPLQKFNLSLKLNKTKTDCRDAGVYSCRAQTGQGVANKSVDVNVRCPQQLENPLIQNKVYLTKTNSSINISVAVLGYPEPTLQLNSDLGLDMKAYNLTYIRQKPSYGVVSLQIYTVTTSVFQNYSLSINNSLGILVYSFQIQEGDPSGSNPGKKDSNVGAIVGGVVGGVLAIVLVVGIVIFLKKRGVFDSKKSPDSTMQLHNEDETEEPTVVFDNKDLYSSGKEVVFDNKDLYATGREAEVVFDNKDLYYSNRKSDEVVTDNSSLYYMGRDAPGQNGQDSTYKSYSKVTTTMTSASAMPSNMTNQKPAAASAYEDVSIAEPSSKKNDKPKPATASKPKPTTKPKPGDPSKQAVNPADQIYATVVKVSKANKPFVVNKEESPPPQPEIPIKAFEKVDKDSINSKTKESVNHNGGNPDQDSSSFSYANNAFSELEDDVNVYANTNK